MILNVYKGRKDSNEYTGRRDHDNDPYIDGGVGPDKALSTAFTEGDGSL